MVLTKLIATAAFGALLLAGCEKNSQNGSGSPAKVRVGYIGLTCEAPIFTAVEKGFFKEEGIEAEVIRTNANVAIRALASGDTDYTMIFGSVVRTAIRGLPVKVVASFIDGSTHALVSRPE